MTIDDLRDTIIFAVIVMIAAISSCFVRPESFAEIDLRDVMVFSGILLISIGVYMIYPAASFIVGGSMLFWLGRPR